MAQSSSGPDLTIVPAEMSPSGESLQTASIVVTAIFIPLASAFVGLRAYTRIKEKNFGLDDSFIIVSILISLVYTASILSTLKYSRHLWDIPLAWFDARYIKHLLVQGMTLGPALFFGKTAILLFYLRLFSVSRTIKWFIYPAIPFTFCLYFTNVVLESVFCIPRKGETWEFSITRCGKFGVWGPVQGVLNILLDVFILVLPIPIIGGLKMSREKKFGLLGIFLTAFFAIIASVLATFYRFKLHSDPGDTTWHLSQLFICVTVENYIIIICSCIPIVAGFVRGKFPRFSNIFPTLASRILRTKKSTVASSSGPSNGASHSSRLHFAGSSNGSRNSKEGVSHYVSEAATTDGYYELHDTLPLANQRGIENSVSIGTGNRYENSENGITRSIVVDQYSTHPK